MRIIKLMILSLIIGFSNNLSAQNEVWILPSNHLNDQGVIIPLPTVSTNEWGYHGDPATTVSNAMQDANGNLLFFIVDGEVYDKDGYTIGVLNFVINNTLDIKGTAEVAIAPVPGNCSQYYIFMAGRVNYSQLASKLPVVVILDMSEPSTIASNRMGELIYGSTIEDILPSSAPDIEIESGYGKQGSSYFAVSSEQNGKRFVFISNPNGIYRFSLNSNGFQYDAFIPFNISGGNNDILFRGEMELVELNNGGNVKYRLAVPIYVESVNYNAHSVFIANLDVNGDLLNDSNGYDTYELPFVFGSQYGLDDLPRIHGLEFSPNGEKLYITHQTNADYPNAFEYYDFNNTTAGVQSVPGITVQQAMNFEHSQIEIGKSGDLYLAHANGLARFTNPNNPSSGLLTINFLSFNYSANREGDSGNSMNLMSYVLPDQIDGMDYSSIGYPSTHTLISYTAQGNETWLPDLNPWGSIDAQIYVQDQLIIPSGKSVTIKNMTFRFAPNAKVIVEQGGKLTLDSSVFTNNSLACASDLGEYWQGVQVYGTTSQNQLPSFNPTHQGMLVLKNGAVIEYAHKAATNWRQNSWNEIGGVIQSTNSVFRNNRRDVEFMAYKNYTPNNPNTEIANFSFFKNTSFISDDDFIENGLPQQAHVTLWQVHGIHFTNCHFSNNILSNKSTSGTPNRGIYAINASFKVGSGCSTMMNPCPSSDVLRSSFVGLERAVEITGASSSKAATITRTDFENNVWGVIVEDYDNVSIDRNHFELGNTGYGANTTGLGVGVITNNSTEFIIEENSVYTPNTNLPHRGIIVQNASSNDNRLYKNTLENLLIGTGAYGINHNSNYQNGLQFLCNSYVKNKTAISIGYNVTVDGVRFYQGDFSTKKSAGNTFSNNLLDIDNTANSIVYFHNWGNTEPMAYQGLVTLDTTSIANSCPTIFGGGIIFTPMVLASTLDSLKLVYNVKKDEYNNLHFNYLSLIDKGNTEYLQNQIETDWSDDAWFLRGKLIQESPYLSTDVLLTTAEQNVLPNGMLLEVLLANPDATRGGSFIAKLREVTNNSFPEYMIDYVKNNFDSRTLRTTLEGQMSSVHSELSSTRNYIKYLEKSADEFSYQERLKTVEMGSDLSHKVGLMDFYIENRQFALADSVLEEIYNDNKMKEEVEFIDNYDSYLLFRTGLGERNLAQLDSTEIDYLKDLAENKGRVAGYAQNILCFFYDICSDIELLNGSAQTKSMNVSGESPTLNEVLYKINVYPNPTVEFTSLSWEIYDELQNAEFRVFDLQGQEVMFGVIEENKSEKALDVRSLDNGVYILAIFNNGEQKLNQKFVVNKPN